MVPAFVATGTQGADTDERIGGLSFAHAFANGYKLRPGVLSNTPWQQHNPRSR